LPTVIINADDFGLNEHITKAIAEAFKRGLITDTTMMATGKYFDEAVALAKEQGFFDRIGVHLNLTEGEPLTEDIKAQPRFVNNGRFHKGYDRRKKLTSAEQEAISKELSAQIEKLQKAGICITHADSHHHVHTGLYIAPVVVRVCREHGINKIRLHRNLGQISFLKRFIKQKYNNWLRKQGFVTTKYFAYVMDVDGKEIPDSTEIMVHPDYEQNGALIDRRGMQDGCPVGTPLIDLRDKKDYHLGGYTELS